MTTHMRPYCQSTLHLAPYATNWVQSKGRFIEEESAYDRSPFQRDRDRIIHSDAFRRLQYKTQVIINSEEGDFRTRLTHTLEVAQLTRSICRSLGLDEDLGEVCALAHDLGHPPFGHAGEDALSAKMKEFGGFFHNLQTMKIVHYLESRYGQFEGLNLTWESLEGIAKHNGPLPAEEADSPLMKGLDPLKHAGLEAQVAALCDDIAYNHHDLDDGLAAGKLNLDGVLELPQVESVWHDVIKEFPNIDVYRQQKEMIRRMISLHVSDVLDNTQKNLEKHCVESVEDVRSAGVQLVCFSPEIAAECANLKSFMFQNMYRHYLVNRRTFQAHRILGELFDAFMNHRRMLPPQAQERQKQLAREAGYEKPTDAQKAEVVCDYLASMTDRSATREYARLFGEIKWL